MMGEVEVKLVGTDFRALLFGVRTEPFAQRQVNQVGRAVRTRDGGAARRIDLGFDRFARPDRSFKEFSGMHLEFAVVPGLSDLELEPGAGDRSGIADLAPLFGIEGGTVEDEGDFGFFAGRGGFGHLPVFENGEDSGIFGIKSLIAEELRGGRALFERFERIVLEQKVLFGKPGEFAVAFHLFLKPFPVESISPFGGERLEEFGRETVGLIHLERLFAGNNGIGADRTENVLDSAEPAFDRAEEMLFFGTDDLLHALDRFAQFGIRDFHQFGHGRNKFEKERFALFHLETVEYGAAQEAADHVFLFLVSRIDVFVYRKRAGAHVVGNPAEPAAVLVGEVLIVVFDSADFAGRQNERLENVDVEVRRRSLERGGGPFEPHAGVDVFTRKGLEIVRRIANAVKLRKDEVPDFDFPHRGLVVDFAAGAADAVGTFRRGAGGPEVFVFVEILEPVSRELDFVEPDLSRFGIVFVDGCRKGFGREPEPFLLGQKLPGPVDCLALEVVAETEVAEHLKKGVMVRGPADVVDIAGAQAFLAGGRAGELEFAPAEEMVLELVHSGRGEQDGGIPAGNENVARAADTPFAFEEGEVLFTQFVGFHGCCLYFECLFEE